jgi:hypothetical protein
VAERTVLQWRGDEASWTGGRAYSLEPICDGDVRRLPLRETGSVTFTWNHQFLHVTAALVDREIIARGDADGLLHHRLGDVCEVFLKPANQAWYCEVHVTPKGHHTTLIWPGQAVAVAEALEMNSGVRATAQAVPDVPSAPVNSPGWLASVAIPPSLLERSGERFAPGHDWRVLVGRYNYSRDLRVLELSSMPALSRADFHLTGEYARLLMLD